MASTAELLAYFENFDKNKDGTISREELKEGLKANKLNDILIGTIMSVADENKNDKIEFNEFCKTIEKFLNYKPPSVEEGKDIFKRCDKNGDGQIGADELVEMAKELNLTNLSGAQAKALVDSIDKNGDGKINEDEFLSLVR